MDITESKKQAIADISLLIVAIIWGASFFIIKLVQQQADPMALLAYRFGLAAIVLGLGLTLKKIALFEKYKHGFILGLILWMAYAPQSYGLNITTASNSAFISGLFVLFVPFFYFFLGKKPLGRKNIIAISLSIFGMWILTGGISGINKGDLLTLIMPVFAAAHIYFTDKYVRLDLNPYTLAFQQFFTVAILSLALVLIFQLPVQVNKSSIIFGILYLSLFANLFAYVTQTVAQKFTSPIKVTLIFAMEPVFAGLFAWTLGKELFIPSRAVGGLLIFLAILISELHIEKLFQPSESSG